MSDQTMWKVTSKNYAPKIAAVAVTSKTVHFLQVKGETRKTAKHSEYTDFFDTFDQAKEFLIGYWEEEERCRRSKWSSAITMLDKINAMVQP